ncbi:MAG: UDP-N-acetylenolpyruvoylglucosamine reductase [Planctomycetes bacterium]|nr:UDP-N-acetylenolpyruvoylglucosamine reductase [Planctomycetota bacterium]
MISRNACAISTARSSPLSTHTTIRIGGPAEVLAFPRDADEVALLVRDCAERGVPWRVLGRGSNLLVADAGVPGVTIHTRDLRSIRFGDGGLVVAGAGLRTSTLHAEAMKRGLGGLECVVGYPATVGGSARMNAGGRWGETGARIEWVAAVDATGEVRTLPRDACNFGYRTSALAGLAVVEVAFRLPEVDLPAYRAAIDAIHAEKSRAQPLAEPSAGCMFRNPPGNSAGRLVDACGLKGRAVGGAMVSTVHGNFVVNRGGATCDDVLRLVDAVRDEVRRRTGVELETEVEVWGAEHVPAHG